VECATPLARSCSHCGSALPAAAKFCPECAHPVTFIAAARPRFSSPESYTPKHLAEKILTSRGALEGERKQVTVLFADLKGSMELLAGRDPEDARKPNMAPRNDRHGWASQQRANRTLTATFEYSCSFTSWQDLA
jgi:hypothetical protein